MKNKIIALALNALLEARNLKMAEGAKLCGIKQSSFNRYCMGQAAPTDIIILVAKTFGVPVERLTDKPLKLMMFPEKQE